MIFNHCVAIERSLGHILDSSAADGDGDERDSSKFRFSSNFENMKNKLLNRPGKTTMLRSSKRVAAARRAAVVEVDDEDDTISIADSEISLTPTVCLNDSHTMDKRYIIAYNLYR